MNFDFVWKLVLRDTDISEHLLILYGIAVSTKAKTIVEIGAGQSTFALTVAANFNEGEFYSIDMSENAYAPGHAPIFTEGIGLLEKEPRFHKIIGDSLKVEWDKPIDLLFIDSGHTYDLTINELKKFTPFVKKGGFICMHDTSESWVDCRRAMLDFTKDKNWELKQLNNQNGFTIIRKI